MNNKYTTPEEFLSKFPKLSLTKYNEIVYRIDGHENKKLRLVQRVLVDDPYWIVIQPTS